MADRICSFEGCGKKHLARGLCQNHYALWYRNGKPEPIRQPALIVECSIPGCTTVGPVRRGWCNTHYQRWQKTGDPLVVRPRPSGPELWWNWSGDPSYNAVHLRLKVQRGSASTHTCVDCGRAAREWSYNNSGVCEKSEAITTRKGTFVVRFSTDLDQYEPRCTPCHRKFDLAHAA